MDHVEKNEKRYFLLINLFHFKKKKKRKNHRITNTQNSKEHK